MHDSRYILIPVPIPIPGKFKSLILIPISVPIPVPIEISDSDSDTSKIGLIPEESCITGAKPCPVAMNASNAWKS